MDEAFCVHFLGRDLLQHQLSCSECGGKKLVLPGAPSNLRFLPPDRVCFRAGI